MAKEETASYEDVDLEEIRNQVDEMGTKAIKAELEEDDQPLELDPIQNVYTKFRVQPAIPKKLKEFFDRHKGSFDRHVALSNTLRKDNLRHLMAIDLQEDWRRIPTHRHNAYSIAIREVAEFQQCRSNPEVGGFEAKIGITSIKKSDIDIDQAQSLLAGANGSKKKKGILRFLKR